MTVQSRTWYCCRDCCSLESICRQGKGASLDCGGTWLSRSSAGWCGLLSKGRPAKQVASRGSCACCSNRP